MARSRIKVKGRRDKERFAGIPHSVMRHPDYISLSPSAKSLLFELALQYNGYNNGDLSAAWSIMSKRGWNSKTTLASALKSLINNDLVVLSRSGRFLNPGAKCSLYAITWQPVNDLPAKALEINPTVRPIRSFRVT